MTTIQVCIGSACHLKGSYHVINRLQEVISQKKLEDLIVIKAAFCLGECTQAVSVQVDEGPIQSLHVEGVDCFIEELLVGRAEA
jgi:NADH:ubiquinone oxidoreductase subunit E